HCLANNKILSKSAGAIQASEYLSSYRELCRWVPVGHVGRRRPFLYEKGVAIAGAIVMGVVEVEAAALMTHAVLVFSLGKKFAAPSADHGCVILGGSPGGLALPTVNAYEMVGRGLRPSRLARE
ncbi:MAG: hypothetical protein LC725_05545, partial [Lentisphaerae bacterium]|nr:hypothetical protein [Lentisphaerota bacterium]